MSEESSRLVPAEPDALDDAQRAYMPRIPWKWLIVGLSLFGLAYYGYTWREHQRALGLQKQIVTAYACVEPIAQHYRALRGHIEKWALQASQQSPPREFVDPRLTSQTLENGRGIYLRVPLETARGKQAFEAYASQMEPDAIGRCLGVQATSARPLFEKGKVLLPEWIGEVRSEETEMRLRVLDAELATVSKRDIPEIAETMRADWFMLTLETGEDRSKAPVHVYVWDVHTGHKLLATRAAANGLLINTRYDVPGAPAAPRVAHDATSGGAIDCSIARQIREKLDAEPPSH